MRNRLADYLWSLALLGLAVGVRIALDPWLGDSLSHPTVFTAVLVTTWYFGTGPAVVNMIAGYPIVQIFVLDSPVSVWNYHYLIPSLCLYTSLNLIIIVLVSKFRKERDRLLETEKTLKKSEERLRANFDNAALGIIETDGEDHCAAVNERICQILGYTRGELLGRSIYDLTAPEDRPRSIELNLALRAGKVDRLDYEKRYLRRDGSPVWVHVTVAAIRDETGKQIRAIGTVEDISRQKQMEHELRAAMTSAKQANAAKDQFLAVLSHELRTPLTPVLAAVQLMEREPNLEARLRRHIEVIRRNLELEARLIDDLLDLTRIVRGKIELDRQHVNVRSVLQRAVEICRPDIEARKLHFGVDIKDPALYINADPSRIQQVFWNLLKNAIKFTPDGGCVGIACREQAGQIIIEVSDSGIGIEPGSAERIFNAFEQGGKPMTRQFGGLGLGLAITKRLVEMHEGTITAQSKGRNKGAIFTVSLPAYSAEVLSGAATNAKEPVSMTERSSRRILLVEDHGDTAEMMQILLEASGFQVERACDYHQAMEIVGSREIDLLISDLGLPDRSGLDLIRELRLRGCNLKAIALSGFGREEDIQRSKEAGFAAHLTKPVDFETLLHTVENIIQRAA